MLKRSVHQPPVLSPTSVKVCVWTYLDLVGPSEAFELPEPHVLRLHPPLPAGRTLLRALPCQHHDQPAGQTGGGR